MFWSRHLAANRKHLKASNPCWSSWINYFPFSTKFSRPPVLDLSRRLESNHRWGAGKVLEKWVNEQPWRFLTAGRCLEWPIIMECVNHVNPGSINPRKKTSFADDNQHPFSPHLNYWKSSAWVPWGVHVLYISFSGIWRCSWATEGWLKAANLITAWDCRLFHPRGWTSTNDWRWWPSADSTPVIKHVLCLSGLLIHSKCGVKSDFLSQGLGRLLDPRKRYQMV